MRASEAPPVYALLGSGRLARHLAHYFRHEGLAVEQWARRTDPAFNTVDPAQTPDAEKRLCAALERCSHALLLLRDDAIVPFVGRHKALKDKVLIHCSGALSIAGVHGAHPLMTFAETLYDIALYRSIPFITDTEGLSFPGLFAGLSNPHYALSAEKKALYHAYCVVSGNFTGLLWERAFAEFETRLGLPKSVLLPYMEQVFANLAKAEGVVTGPLVRRDLKTIERNLRALDGSDLKPLYEAFVRFAGLDVPNTDSPSRPIPPSARA